MYQPPRNTGIRFEGKPISIQPLEAENHVPATKRKYSVDVPESLPQKQAKQEKMKISEKIVAPSPTSRMDVDENFPPSIQGNSKAATPISEKVGPVVASSRRFNKFDSWLVRNVREITQETYTRNNAPLFVLENTMEAAKTLLQS
jgi:hypothetical protein